MIIVIDTREQKPYNYKDSVYRALPTGDYSIVGLESRVCVERKTKSDLFATLGQGRERFHREIHRMREYDYAAIIIESSLTGLLTRPEHSKMHPSSVINTLIAWSVRHGVHVYFADSRKMGRALTFRVLEKFFNAYGK